MRTHIWPEILSLIWPRVVSDIVSGVRSLGRSRRVYKCALLLYSPPPPPPPQSPLHFLYMYACTCAFILHSVGVNGPAENVLNHSMVTHIIQSTWLHTHVQFSFAQQYFWTLDAGMQISFVIHQFLKAMLQHQSHNSLPFH